MVVNLKDSVSGQAINTLFSYRDYRNTHNFLKKSQYWSKDDLEEYQLNQLDKLLNHSYENVPYYTRILNEQGIKPRDIQDFKDLEMIPFLTKEIIKENLPELKARNYQEKKFEYVTTGGSSGTPLGFYYEKGVSRAQEWAFIKTLWDRIGYHFRDKCAVLRGSVVKSAEKGVYWEKSLAGRALILSSYHLSEKTLPSYIKALNNFNPKFIQAYPSTILMLARFMKINNIGPKIQLKAILCSSENLYPDQRKLLEDVFKCRIFTWYGHTERTVLAGECEKSEEYHIFPEYGIFELIQDNGKLIKKSNYPGAVVGTCLTNYVMPLIRYKTDDAAAYSSLKCECSREYKTIKDVQGRWLKELIYGTNGRIIPIAALSMHSDVYDNVEKYQFYQEIEEELIVNIVKKDSYTEKDTEYITREILKKIGSDMKLELVFVEDIARTRRGKQNSLIQKLPENLFNS